MNHSNSEGLLLFSDGPAPYRWSAVASASLMLVAGAMILCGVDRGGAILMGLSLVPFSASTALDAAGSARFHIAYAKGQWWAAGFIRATPLWLMRLGAGLLAAVGSLVAIVALSA